MGFADAVALGTEMPNVRDTLVRLARDYEMA